MGGEYTGAGAGRLRRVPPSDPDPTGARRRAETARHQPGESADRLMRTCPNCGSELEERRCKLFCPRPACGFYLSCADFY